MLPFIKRLPFVMIIALLFLSGCNLPADTTPTQGVQPDLIYTAAAQTVAAQLTQAAVNTQSTPLPPAPTQGMEVTATSAPQPTATNQPPAATNTPLPTSTQVPPTAIPTPCDRASFVKDISYADGAEVAAGATFVKTWRLKNNGSCTWNSSYALVFASGDAMNGPASQQLTTGTVAPGQEIDVSVTLKAPDKAGDYAGNWKLRNGSNAVFGIGADASSPFWVKVKVVNPVTPTPTASVLFDFIAKAAGAEWRNANASLPWGDPNEDSAGVATYIDNVKLNDGKTYSRVLATYPQRVNDGVITGLYSSYVIQNGDHFKASVGFQANCGNGKVKFQLNYIENGTAISLREWNKSCDNNLLVIDVDLSSLNGKTVSFMLAVVADGAMDDDRAVWVDPRIVR